MKGQWIEFISAYCDSWCERCAFTDRCSHFAVRSAIAMCDGDADAALELAFGPARSPSGAPQETLHERMADAMADFEPTDKELDEIGREMDARQERIRKSALAEASLDYAVAARRWLEAHERGAAPDDSGDPAVREAMDVIGWDSHLIHVKIMRALSGRDEYPNGAPFEKSAVQSDWNGSAKVALLSIERSHAAWRSVAALTADEAARVLGDNLAQLRVDLLKEFPRAMKFRRPGFDR
jgi:hypothetical protein